MNENYEITPLSSDFDFSKVPGWYTFCFNSACPLHEQCMRFFAGTYVPKKVLSARCVLPHALQDGKCRWFDKIQVVTMALGFSHLFDQVLKRDYTMMRKRLTAKLIGPRQYYEFKRGDRPLSPEQQEMIRRVVRSFGYEWEVPFDRYFQAYRFGNPVVDE